MGISIAPLLCASLFPLPFVEGNKKKSPTNFFHLFLPSFFLSRTYAIADIKAIANIASNPGIAGFGVGVAFFSVAGGAVGFGVGFIADVAVGFGVSPDANVGVGTGVSPGANVGVDVGVTSSASVDVDATDHIQVRIVDKPVSVLIAIAETFQIPATALVFV